MSKPLIGGPVEYKWIWRVRTRLGERFGQRCAVLTRGSLNSCLVQFEDGQQVITSRDYVRKAESWTHYESES